MNTTEAAQVLAVMAAPHPWDVDDDQADIWYQAALHAIDHGLGLDVAMRLVETEERFPTPARFNRERATIERERYLAGQEVEQPALPSMPTDESERVGHLAEMRTNLGGLAKTSTRGHWHGGPAPCPVCGGIAPGVLAAMGPADRLRCEMQAQGVKDAQRARFGPRSW